MTPISDLYAILKGDGLALDRAECAALGGPTGETISEWMALRSRHGSVMAHWFCIVLSVVVQRHHCRDQIAGVPMQPVNYLLAGLALVVFAPVAFGIGAARFLFSR